MRTWDAATGEPLGEPLIGHDVGVSSVAFSPDEATVASAGDDATVRLWAAPEAWVPLLCDAVNRNPTRDEWEAWIGPDVPYVRSCPDLPASHGAPTDASAAEYPEPLRNPVSAP